MGAHLELADSITLDGVFIDLHSISVGNPLKFSVI